MRSSFPGFIIIVLAGICTAAPEAWGQDSADRDTMPVHAPTTKPQSDSTGKEAHTNRLSKETSPYLLQHAHNPVDWYAWGPEAFEAARKQDKPIFLSVGYSTCYWCHVMERESFESEATAAIMNEHFINIKVDREERPDVDAIYMAAVQAMSGRGGWPMSVFLEPTTLKPIMGGTYFPPTTTMAGPGFPQVLQYVANAWKTDRANLMKQADQVAKVVNDYLSQPVEAVQLSGKDVDKAVATLVAAHDAKDGGWLSPPTQKFPMPSYLMLLMDSGWNDKSARDAVTLTLDRMATGGMYDQIGGGFHRYSTDVQWSVPHFEKMLYDNAQLASAYARAYELTKDDFYAEIVRETLDYVLREMTSAEGGFFSAQDAEVNTLEGGNYVWNAAEVTEALDKHGLKSEAQFALEAYGLSKGPNFHDPHHAEAEPKNVLFLIDRPDKLATKYGKSVKDIDAQLEKINKALLAERAKRDQPATDDKVLSGWNGLMIAGMADGGRVLNEPRYKDAAAKAATFVLEKMRPPNSNDGGLVRSYRAGQAKIDATLDDYAMMIRGLLALHRSTKDARWLEEAKRLTQVAKTKFLDQSSGSSGGGGYFDTLAGQSDLFVRVKSISDSEVPSGNSLMLHNLLDLHETTGQSAYLDDAAATLKFASSTIHEHPQASALAVLALKRFVDKYPQRLTVGGAVAQATPSPPAKTQATPVAPIQPVKTGKKPPLEFTTSVKEIQVKPGVPASFEIKLTVNSPFHIMAHVPGDEFLIPLEIKLANVEGLKMTVDYPKGESFKSEASTSPVFVHHGSVTIPVRIEQVGKYSGQPRITMTYQACNDRECFDPKTEIVGMRIIAQR